MFKNKNIIVMVFLIAISTVNTSLADNSNKQYMQIYHQQQLEKATQEKARYEAAHNPDGSRKGLVDIVGGNCANTRTIEFNYGHEMTDAEYEEFQRQNRW